MTPLPRFSRQSILCSFHKLSKIFCEEKQFEGVGNGPIDAVQRGLEEELGINIKVLDYSEHALTSGSGAQAASYIHVMDQKDGRVTYGVGISSNITRASLRGIFSAVNRLFGE